MLFDGPPSELPIATLRPTVRGRRRRFAVELERWLAVRRAWLRPRAVPLLVAFASLFATLGSIKAIAIWTNGEPLALSMRARMTSTQPSAEAEAEPAPRGCLRYREAHRPPVRIVLRPLAPGDRYTELTIGALDPR
jgi:hypothetical protein